MHSVSLLQVMLDYVGETVTGIYTKCHRGEVWKHDKQSVP